MDPQSEFALKDQRPKPPNKFVVFMRKIYRPLGFQKGYNFPLCEFPKQINGLLTNNILVIIFAGAMMGFTLARMSYLNIGGSAPSSFRKGAAPGEWYHYHTGAKRIGITLHLAGCLPAGFLMVWQFVPIIRHKFLLFHRINGYVIIVLVFICLAGALMIARTSFGGSLDVQTGVGVLAILVTGAIAMAYYNIKRLQIDQHRAWMLRAMFYLGTIITERIIQISSATIISSIGSYYQIQTCNEVAFQVGARAAAAMYPKDCPFGYTGNPHILVHASMTDVGPQSVGAALGLSFGMALWLAVFLHLIGVEIYLNLTPVEGERLRTVSYERQLEAGFKNPGSAGLTSDRWGDAPEWRPKRSESLSSTEAKVDGGDGTAR
ncbi:hypothetical protein B0J14DRAFT_130625 [Halenospora varia]|nr:hypothetical protein B0J14DRAFT_130625 [Halenospora varia]